MATKKIKKEKEKLSPESLTINGSSSNREKDGKCSVYGCSISKVLDCILCGRYDLCFAHMGGYGFTRVFCPECLHKENMKISYRSKAFQNIEYILENKPHDLNTLNKIIKVVKENSDDSLKNKI